VFFEVARDAEGVEDAIRDGFFVAQGQNLQNPPTTATLLLPNRA